MRIAYCILTHGHSDTLLQASMYYFELFQTLGIDIYIYDSSTDTKTYSLYQAWLTKSLTNLYYVDCRHIHTADEKLLNILKGYGLEKEYDYIWPTKDRIILSKSHVTDILRAADSSPDIIMTARKRDSYFYQIPDLPVYFEEPVPFFRYYGATSTSWESTIFNYNTVLKDIDWNLYDTVYKVNKENPFIQPCTLFTRLAELTTCQIKIVRPEPGGSVALKASSSGWVKDTVDLWAHKWPEAIRSLPSIYDTYKDYVIKTETMHPLIFGSIDQLIYLRDNDWLTDSNFENIRDFFPLLSDIPLSYMDLILQKNYTLLYHNLYQDFSDALQKEDYFKAMWIHNTAPWLRQLISQETYMHLQEMFANYQVEMMENRASSIFQNVHSIEDAERNYQADSKGYRSLRDLSLI